MGRRLPHPANDAGSAEEDHEHGAPLTKVDWMSWQRSSTNVCSGAAYRRMDGKTQGHHGQNCGISNPMGGAG